jgi:hypothetical protein
VEVDQGPADVGLGNWHRAGTPRLVGECRLIEHAELTDYVAKDSPPPSIDVEPFVLDVIDLVDAFYESAERRGELVHL